MTNSERQLNQTAYRKLQDTLNKSYPAGQFLGISGGQVVADSDDFDSLRSTLQTLGVDPSSVLIVQAGADYPESATILAFAREE
jgi:hypothetical protein